MYVCVLLCHRRDYLQIRYITTIACKFMYNNKYVSSVTAAFEDTNNLDGWNCGKITKCGKYGSVCGGYATKGRGDDIQKTFDVPEGKYSVTLDFIKIDSWFVW